MASKKLTYEAAYSELQEILVSIQQDEINLDSLAQKLKRAKELIEFCKDKLHAVEEELDEIFSEEED